MTEGVAATRSIDAFVGDAGTFRIRGTNSGDSSGHQVLAEFRRNAGVHLNYSGSTMLETTSNGVTIVGEGDFTSHSLKIRNWGLIAAYKGLFHANHSTFTSEFILINNETHTRLGTGSGGNIQLEVGGNSEDAINCNHNGAVELYYDNSKKFETSSTGGIFRGTNFTAVDDCKISFGNSDDFQIYHDGVNSLQFFDSQIGQVRFRTNTAGTARSNLILSTGVKLYHGNNLKLETFGSGIITQHIQPDADDDHDVGSSAKRFDNIHASNGTIQTSDRNEKENILTSDLGLDFINKLTPVSFKFKNKTRTHYGLVAQDIETVITDLGKTTTQFAPLIKETLENGTERYGLRYTELLSPLIKAIQELSAKVAALEAA